MLSKIFNIKSYFIILVLISSSIGVYFLMERVYVDLKVEYNLLDYIKMIITFLISIGITSVYGFIVLNRVYEEKIKDNKLLIYHFLLLNLIIFPFIIKVFVLFGIYIFIKEINR